MRLRPSILGLASLLAFAPLAACVADREPPIEPDLAAGGGKADVVDRVELRGALALGGEVTGSFAEDLEFHGYIIDVRPGAAVTLEIARRGTQVSVDTALFLYGPERLAVGYGTAALERDDDSGWGKHARLDEVVLEAGGRYLVVVGTHDGRGRGNYRLTATCEAAAGADACAPLAAAGECHPAIAADIRACVADLMSDPEAAPAGEVEAVALCADAEPTADAYDALCDGAAPPSFCGSIEDFATAHLPRCAVELTGEVLDRTCVFGSVYRDLWARPWLRVLRERKLTSVAGTTAVERAQIVAAVHASSHTDVTTAEEALARVDQGEINVVDVWDASGRRAFTALEYGAGDNSYGRVFGFGTADGAVDIHDGDLEECTAMVGPEVRDCTAAADCAAGLDCVGIGEESPRGSCIDLAADGTAAEGAACGAVLDVTCPIEDGLACAGLTRGDEGICLPAWMQRSFASLPALAIPDNAAAGARAQLLVYGLATVDMDVLIAATILHPRPADLRAALIAPDGTEVMLETEGAVVDGGLELDQAVEGLSGDAAVNGLWALRVSDRASGRTGTIERVALTVGSRWD